MTDKKANSAEETATAAPAKTGLVEIILENPISRGADQLTAISLREPKSGELRGLSLSAIAQMEIDELTKLLPRITMPNLIAEEVAQLSLPDLMQFATGVAGFFLTRDQKAASP